MKVLIVSHYFPPHLGGTGIVAQNQARYLVKEGQSVAVLTGAISSPKGSELHNDGYQIHRVAASNITEEKFGAPFPFFSPTIFWKTYTLVKNADVVHVHDAFYISSYIAAFWAWALRKPLVLTQHVAMIPHPKKFIVIAQQIVYKTTGRFIFNKSGKIIILNSRVKDFLINEGVLAKKIVFLANGINLNIFFPSSSSQKRKLRKKYQLPEKTILALFVGRFAPKKGFNKLIESAGKDYTVVFVGGNKPKKLHKKSNTIFLGSFSQQETAEIYRACDIFILPSEGEGFPLSIQEAMASGLPIITSNDKGYSVYKFNPKLFWLINPSIPEIKKSLEKLTQNSKLRETMGNYSVEYVNAHFSWESNVKRVVSTYQDIAS